MDKDILIISEKDQKAYLPYKYKNVEEIYNKNKDIYSSIDDLI